MTVKHQMPVNKKLENNIALANDSYQSYQRQHMGNQSPKSRYKLYERGKHNYTQEKL